ncbi:high-affinity nickel-transport protein-domain-containing protein [Scleroderma yunnanense]
MTVNVLKLPSLTLFGRSLLLVSVLLLANAVCWAVAVQLHALLGLALLAWTIGLRHALDADHISAIDNATRTLINHGQLPVTCGLFFSLGHSTIVIVVNCAIVVSTSVYNKFSGFSNIASVIGPAISGSFLFIVGLANSVILWRIIRRRRRLARRETDAQDGDPPNQNMLMMRLLGPLVNFVNRPWKMYPVGFLFGLGFDTASSIALLALSALAQQSDPRTRVQPSAVIVLPLLFTTGMTLVDSLDSILMIYSYSGFTERSWKIIKHTQSGSEVASTAQAKCSHDTRPEDCVVIRSSQQGSSDPLTTDGSTEAKGNGHHEDDGISRAKRHTMSNLSILLTTMSILLAFSIALIEIMGLIGQECTTCQKAASAPDGGGLAGKWWRAWLGANENSGYIGAAVVGVFVIVVAGWYGCQWIIRTRRKRSETAKQK